MDKKDLFKVLQERGYIYQATNLEEIEKMLTKDTITAYVGIDPTADSLHIGHCFPLIIAKYLQEAGHKIIVVLGGATAKIGDPSGKSTMRQMVPWDRDKYISPSLFGFELIYTIGICSCGKITI